MGTSRLADKIPIKKSQITKAESMSSKRAVSYFILFFSALQIVFSFQNCSRFSSSSASPDSKSLSLIDPNTPRTVNPPSPNPSPGSPPLPALVPSPTPPSLPPPLPTPVPPSPQTGSWNLTFSDEFLSGGLNTDKWQTHYRWDDRTLSGNGELECYFDDDVYSYGGLLILRAQKRTVLCPKINTNFNYTSGMIATFDKFSQTYGYFEMRAKLPAGQGLWPAFWLLPQSGAWPPEIDILEVLGHEPSTTYQTFHYKNPDHKSDGSSTKTVNSATGFHTYGVDWQYGLLIWYIDGVEVKRFQSPLVPNEPHYIIANLAVGGNWPGSPNSATDFPAQMEIDYIRVYQRMEGSSPLPPFGN